MIFFLSLPLIVLPLYLSCKLLSIRYKLISSNVFSHSHLRNACSFSVIFFISLPACVCVSCARSFIGAPTKDYPFLMLFCVEKRGNESGEAKPKRDGEQTVA